jgi:hypothetical protein
LESHKQELAVYGWLNSWLPTAKRAKYKDSFDILYGEKRIEVKASRRSDNGLWYFNIHRHGVLKEDGIFAYIFRVEDVPGFEYALHLVVPAPLGRSTIVLSLRSLILYWGRFANRLSVIDPAVRESATRELLRNIDKEELIA